MTFTAFGSSMDWLIFDSRLMPSPIVFSRRVTTCPWWRCKNFLNDLVTDSPHLGRVRPVPTPFNSPGGGQPTKKRPNDDPMVEAAKRRQRGEGSWFGRGRSRGGGRGGCGRFSPNTGRIDLNAIARALTPQERKRHKEEGLCFKFHKKGHSVFQCPELKGKEAVDESTKQKMIVA
jgi:hypothetical protein